MEEKEIICVDRFIKEMEGYGYRLSVDIEEKPSSTERNTMAINVNLSACTQKPLKESSWRRVAMRFFL